MRKSLEDNWNKFLSAGYLFCFLTNIVTELIGFPAVVWCIHVCSSLQASEPCNQQHQRIDTCRLLILMAFVWCACACSSLKLSWLAGSSRWTTAGDFALTWWAAPTQTHAALCATGRRRSMHAGLRSAASPSRRAARCSLLTVFHNLLQFLLLFRTSRKCKIARSTNALCPQKWQYGNITSLSLTTYLIVKTVKQKHLQMSSESLLHNVTWLQCRR